MPDITTAEWAKPRPRYVGRHRLIVPELPDGFDISAYANVQGELAIAVQRIRIRGHVPKHATPTLSEEAARFWYDLERRS